jgi:microcystin degradation protein MlrC
MVKRAASADVIILCKELPDTHIVERADDLLTLVLRTIRKELSASHLYTTAVGLAAIPQR